MGQYTLTIDLVNNFRIFGDIFGFSLMLAHQESAVSPLNRAARCCHSIFIDALFDVSYQGFLFTTQLIPESSRGEH